MATKQEIDRIIEAVDIVDLVSKYVRLEKSGKNYKGLCPFHHEDTPSFVVSPEKKLAHCFGCKGGGNPVKFLMEIEGIDYYNAIEKLSKMTGIKIENNYVDNVSQALAKYHKIMQTSISFYQKYLENTVDGKLAYEYLYKRGIDDEIIKVFNIGLSPDKGNTLYKVLKESGYFELDMSDVGLVDKSKVGYFDLFYNRIMFPIYDENANPIGYSARIFKSKDESKYINTRDTLLFKKGDILYNLHLAKGEMLRKKRVILYEGQMDVIASYRSGLKEAICTMGTALTAQQAKILRKYTNNAVICYDGDKAGINASKKAISIFKSAGFNVKLVLLPNGMDPDEFVLKYGPESYYNYFNDNLIDSTKYLFDVAFINKDLNSQIVCDEIKIEVFELLNTGLSATDLEFYLNNLAMNLRMSLDAIKIDFNNYCKNNKTYTPNIDTSYMDVDYPEYGYTPVDEPVKIKKTRWNHICEVRLFIYSINSKEEAIYINKILDNRLEGLSQDSQALWFSLMDYYNENEIFEEKKFIELLQDDSDKVDYYIDVIEAANKDKTVYSVEDRNLCLNQLKIIKYKKLMERIDELIKNPENKDDVLRLITLKFEYLREYNELEKARRK